MATGNSSRITLDETLALFDRADGTIPFTASEVADELDCARRTAYGKLEELAERGDLRTKKVGARGRVWWRPDADRVTAGRVSAPVHAQFDELVDEVDDYAIFILDADGHVASWNRGAEQIKGYDTDDIVGEHFSTFYTDEDREAGIPERNLRTAKAQGRIEDEGWRVHEDGTRFWANVVITALTDDEGGLRGYMKVTRDMTERHEQEERLRREKERFETLVREVRDYAIFLLDTDGIVQTWNEGAEQIKGYDADDIVGEHFSTFYTDEEREAGVPERNLRKAKAQGRIEDEGERVRDDGSTFWANVIITALHSDGGELRGFAKVTRDMTERHRYEEQLREQRDELRELNQINAVIRDIDQALVGAASREEIEEAVCDRLAESDTYASAWVAEYADDYETMTPRTSAGMSDDYLEAIRTADAAAEGTERSTGATAIRTRTVQPVQRLGSDLAGDPWREASLDEGYESAIAVPLVYSEVEYGVLTVYAEEESAFDQRKVAVMGELGETISHAIAAIRRKERERTLTAIQESTRELLHAETRAEIGDIIVETLTDGLAMADALLYAFDTTENTLEPVSSSFQPDAYTGQQAPLTAGTDSPVWESFVEGESRLSESAIPASGMGPQRTMLVPLGDYGVLAVVSAERETFERNTRSLVELVAATAEAAFDRVESRANLRERDELLQEQNQRLQRLNQINTIIREVDQGLVQATTREEIQRVVCERLTESGRFRFAWLGVPDDAGDGLVPRAWSGTGRAFLDSVELAPGRGVNEVEPAIAAARTEEVTVVSNVAGDLRAGQWRKEAFAREFQSAIAVPLRYGTVTYGVLAVYADRPGVFESMERSVFTELGQTIANAINAVETRHRLLSDKVVDLEFRLRDESASFLSRLAGEIGCEVEFDGVIPLTEEEARLFFTARGAPLADVREVLERSVGVESFQVVVSRENRHSIEAVISGPTVPSMLVEHGASLRDLTVADGEVRVVVDIPARADVRTFIEQFQHRYESAEFVARRERERPVQSRDGFRDELESTLTERQLEVLKTAYLSGFFASPRQSTGRDVADVLDVSQPTVTEHLRTAQAKVLGLLFEEEAPA